MHGSSYRVFMEKAGAYLELRLCTSDLVEVRDLGDLLNSLANQYDDYVKSHYSNQEHEGRFYVQEIRRGSIIVEFLAASIGMMDQIVILKQFFEITRADIGAVLGGAPRKISAQKRGHIADMVKAVARSEEGSLSLAYKEKDSDGDEAVLMVTKGEAQQITTTLNESLPAFEAVNKLVSQEETGPNKRVLMRFWQHNKDPNVIDKKKTGHRVIITDLWPKPLPLTYPVELEADKLAAILDEHPYGKLVFDVTVAPRLLDGKIKAYGLLEVHDWFEDEEDDSALIQ